MGMNELKNLFETISKIAGRIFQSVLGPLVSAIVARWQLAAFFVVLIAGIIAFISSRAAKSAEEQMSQTADRFNRSLDPNRSGRFRITKHDMNTKQKLKNGIFKLKTVVEHNNGTFNSDRQIVSGKIKIAFLIINNTRTKKKVKLESKIHKEGKRFYIAFTKPIYYTIDPNDVLTTDHPYPFDSDMNEFSKLPSGRYIIKIFANRKDIYRFEIVKE